MTPHSISTVTIGLNKTPAQKAAERGWVGRHGSFKKGDKLPETRVLACPRVKVADLPDGFIPPKYYERNLEQNQQIASCCRHPENHEIEAHKSHPDEPAPDSYTFICNGCGRRHVRLMLGLTDDVPRPVWDAA